MGSGTETSESMVVEHNVDEIKEDMTVKMQKRKRKTALNSMQKNFKIMGYNFSPSGKAPESVEERMQQAHKALCFTHVQKQRRAVGDEIQTDGGENFTTFSASAAKTGRGVGLLWTKSEDGNQR